jgi:GWxTD domain-containing protein
MNWLKILNWVWDRMNSRLVPLLLISFFLLTIVAVGQEENILLQYDRDFAQFRMNKEVVYLEIYYSIPRQGISHKTVAEGYRGAFQIATQIIKNDTKLLTDTINVEDHVESLSQISPGQKFAEISSFALAEGSYLIKSELIDLLSKKSIIKIDTIQIKHFPHDKLTLSAIEFASSISAQKEIKRKFDKNRLRVIPNADRVYGRDLPTLFFYSEAYNFSWEEDAQKSTYQVSYKIINGNGVAVLDLKGKEKKKPGNTSVVYGSLDISELASGTYSFELEVKDIYNMHVAKAEKQFFIYNKSNFIKKSVDGEKQVEWTDSEKYKQMDEEQLDAYFNQLKYIADKDEKRVFKELSFEGKRNFIIAFWSKRDPNPATPLNEREIQYNNLLEIANEKYSHVFREGWETDRGRVLLLYGLPDTKDIYPTTTETKAYEIWEYYNIEGGVKFIFVDKRQNGDYELVHSTKRGEISDSDWRMNHARL